MAVFILSGGATPYAEGTGPADTVHDPVAAASTADLRSLTLRMARLRDGLRRPDCSLLSPAHRVLRLSTDGAVASAPGRQVEFLNSNRLIDDRLATYRTIVIPARCGIEHGAGLYVRRVPTGYRPPLLNGWCKQRLAI